MGIESKNDQECLIMGKGVAFGKKVGDFIKKESESLIFTGLKILRDYYRE